MTRSPLSMRADKIENGKDATLDENRSRISSKRKKKKPLTDEKYKTNTQNLKRISHGSVVTETILFFSRNPQDRPVRAQIIIGSVEVRTVVIFVKRNTPLFMYMGKESIIISITMRC